MPRKLTLLAIGLAALGPVCSVPVAQATPACQVQNARMHAKYTMLQAAVEAASPGDLLRVKHTCYGDTTISKNLTIDGQGSATLDGENNEERPGSVVTVNEDVTVAVTGLTITGGSGSAGPSVCECTQGAGIHNEGSLTLTNSTVSNNHIRVSPFFATYGGGIWSDGSLKLRNSTVTANQATFGGGIYNEGSVTLDNSDVTGNRGNFGGGGVLNDGSLTLKNSKVTGNSEGYVYSGGGGILNYGAVTLINSTVATNKGFGDGGISNQSGSVALINSTVVGNRAGHQYCIGEGGTGGIGNNAGSLTLTNSTVSGNLGLGGGISNGGSLTLNNSNVTGNNGTEGGGISNGGSLTLNNSNVTGNVAFQGGGIENRGGSLTLNNSNVTGNEAVAFTEPCPFLGPTGKGGGIRNYSKLFLNGSSSVTRNKALYGGGIFNEQSEGATITFGVGWTGTVSGNEPDDIFNE